MIFTISLYIFSTALAFAMIARKIWQLRSGRIVSGSYEEADWTDLSIESIRSRLGEITKFTVHHFVLFMLHVWIVIANWVKSADKWIKKKLTLVLHKNGHLPAGGKPSRFLKNIRAHKDQVASNIQKEAGGAETETAAEPKE